MTSKDKAKSLITKVLPVGSRRRKIVKALVKRQPLPDLGEITYREWIERQEPKTINEEVRTSGPLISIVVPCYNTPPKYIQELVESIKNQTYANWQLCLADGSEKQSCSKAIEAAAASDLRITYIKLEKNFQISANTNRAIEQAKGEFIVFMDHDDILPTWALNEVAQAIRANPKAEIFYSDEDRLSANGKTRMIPIFKPDWSPDLFTCVNYPAHLLVAKTKLVKKLKGLRSAYDGSQDYDFILRALDHHPQIVHIPKILYHMRMASSSTAKDIGIKSYVHDAGDRALTEYFKRNRIEVKVLKIANRPTNYRIAYQLKSEPLVSIIIPFKDKIELLKACFASIKAKTSYKNYEVILISNQSTEQKTFDYLSSLKRQKNVHIYEYNQPFNYSAINNFGRRQAKGRVLVFLNNDTEVINKEWLGELASVAVQKDRGAVGAMLLYPDKTIQHAGVVVGMAHAAGHIFRNLKPGTFTPFWLPDWPRNYLAVTGACLAVEAKKFDRVGGFEEKIVMAGSDVVLCLDLYKAGFLNVYWPYAQLLHYENKSVGSYQNAPPTDYEISIEHYRPFMNHNDPYYNPNLDLTSEQPKFRSDHES